MTVTRHLALWACALSVTTTASAYEDTGRPGPDGIWKVCSPAWAFPQLDDAALTADEAWRVEKYLGRAACSSSTPIICHICAGLAERSDGASNAPVTCPLRKGDNPIDSLLQQTTGQVSACAQATKGVVTLHKYYGELSCLLEAYSRATPLVVLPPSLQWRFRFGDETMAMKGAYLTKARKVGTHDQAVLLPINTHRHARDLRPLQRITEHKLPTFLAREKCAMWRGVTTGQLPAYQAYEARVNGRDSDVKKYAKVPLNTRVELVTRFGQTASVAGIRLDVGFSQVSAGAGAASKGLLRDYVKPRATVADQARCKYQLSNEGNDVSTGLKWQLYTDSVVVMPPPTMETWVLEGSLEPFVHYVPVQRDWSDLEARLAWAEAHPAAAANISANARAHVLKTLGASAASERRVVMAVLRGYRQALACAQSA